MIDVSKTAMRVDQPDVEVFFSGFFSFFSGRFAPQIDQFGHVALS